MLGVVLFADALHYCLCLLDAILQQEIVSEGKRKLSTHLRPHCRSKKEVDISLFQLHVANGGFILISKEMSPWGIIGIVLEEGQGERITDHFG
jgi:hypothetical protein